MVNDKSSTVDTSFDLRIHGREEHKIYTTPISSSRGYHRKIFIFTDDVEKNNYKKLLQKFDKKSKVKNIIIKMTSFYVIVYIKIALFSIMLCTKGCFVTFQNSVIWGTTHTET